MKKNCHVYENRHVQRIDYHDDTDIFSYEDSENESCPMHADIIL